MNKNILLSVGITILFLGLAVQPSVATVQSKGEINVEPNQIIILGLITKLRVLVNIIRLRCSQEPEIVIKCEELLKVLDYSLVLKDIFCTTLLLIWAPLFALAIVLGEAGRVTLAGLVLIPFAIIYAIWDIFCFNPWVDYETVSTIQITLNQMQGNIVECPCMQH